MSYATLMVYVDPQVTHQQPVRLAVDLANRFASKLIGISAMPLRPPVIAHGVMVSSVTDDEIDATRERLQQKEDWFRQLAGASHRGTDWRSEIDFPTEFLLVQSRLADLVIHSPNRSFVGAYDSLDTGRFIVKAGRPVLVVPPDLHSLKLDRIVIGWKDAREARRAVADALPLLHESTNVTIAQIRENGDEKAVQRSLNDVVHFLTQHRVKCGSKILLHREGSGAAQLIRLARDEGADLLVTGAYGHSRLGDWIFGGVTEALLSTSPICCLMSH